VRRASGQRSRRSQLIASDGSRSVAHAPQRGSGGLNYSEFCLGARFFRRLPVNVRQLLKWALRVVDRVRYRVAFKRIL